MSKTQAPETERLRYRDLFKPETHIEDIQDLYVYPRHQSRTEQVKGREHIRGKLVVATVVASFILWAVTGFGLPMLLAGVALCLAAFFYDVFWFSLVGYTSWVLHRFGVAVFTATSIASVVAVATADAGQKSAPFLLAAASITGLLICLVVWGSRWGFRKMRSSVSSNRATTLQALTAAERVYNDLFSSQTLMDHYSPVSEYKTAHLRRSDFPSDDAFTQANEKLQSVMAAQRSENLRNYIVRVEDDDERDGVVRVTFRNKEGTEATDLERKAEKLNSDLNCYGVSAFKVVGPSGFVGMRLIADESALVRLDTPDGFAYPMDIEPTETSIPFGMTEFGDNGCLGWSESNVIFGGAPGGGKSVGQRAFLYGVSQLDHVAIVGIDLKKVELAPWDPRLSARAKTVEQAAELVELIYAEVTRRYDVMEDLGLNRITKQAAVDLRMPRITIAIDELAMLTSFTSANSSKEEKAMQGRISLILRKLVAEGRAAGVNMMFATQKPSAKVLDPDLRDLFQQGSAWKTKTPVMTEMILGTGTAENAPAHQINTDATSKGICFVMNEESDIAIKMRSYYIPGGDHLRDLVASVAHKRVELDFLREFNQTIVAEAAARRSSVTSAHIRETTPVQVNRGAAAPAAFIVGNEHSTVDARQEEAQSLLDGWDLEDA